MKRIIIAGGGTGGHFYPGFALAGQLIKKGWQAVFAVKKGDMSIPLLIASDIPFVEIDMMALPGGLNPFQYFIFLWKLITSLLYSVRIIKDFQPITVLGMGSYVAFPLILAARLKKVKTFIHESNAILGLSNYLSGFFAYRILAGLPMKDNPFKKKTDITGTPIRENFQAGISSEDARKKMGLDPSAFTILVFGGSQGAQNINEAVYRLVLDAITEKKKLQLLHITGRKNYTEIKEKYEKIGATGAGIKVYDYREDMEIFYAAADLVISRSGSGTITELITLKKPAILIPLGTAASDHQTLNAEVLSRYACAIVLKDDDKLYTNLKKAIEKLINQSNLAIMVRGYERLKIPSGLVAVENIIEILG